jgi:hypothetical protein
MLSLNAQNLKAKIPQTQKFEQKCPKLISFLKKVDLNQFLKIITLQVEVCMYEYDSVNQNLHLHRFYRIIII